MTTIPNPPTQGDEFTNDVTGVKYRYDGSKWVVISTPESEDIVELTQRVADGETVQAQIQETISDALEVQERTLKKDEVNTVTNAFRVRSDNRTFISTANNELGLYNVADPTNPAHALSLGYADGRYLQSTDLDGAYLPLSGGEISGDVTFRGLSQFYNSLNLRAENRINFLGPSDTNLVGYIKAVSNNEFTIAAYSNNSINIKDLNAPSDPTDAATKGYVDGLVAPFVTADEVDTKINTETVHLPLTGGTLTNGLNINKSNTTGNSLALQVGGNTALRWNFQTNDEIRQIVDQGKVFKLTRTVGGSQQRLIEIASSGTFGIYNLRTPSAATDAATMGYVDTEVAKVAGQTQTFWYAANHQTAENLQPGEFFISDTNDHLYLHTTSANGADLSVGSSERVFNVATLFSVHETNGNSMYCAKSDRINFGSGSNNYMRVAQDTVFLKQQLNQGTEYILNIPGFTP